MPPSKGTGHPLRLLGVYALLLAVIYALVFFTGDKSAEPKLGIDLQGGTRVTLTARTPDGSKPSQDSLKQAQQIIESRVNGLGVAGSEVVIDGSNLVITVPGEDGQQAKALATTAKLYIRPVLQAAQPQGGAGAQQPGGAQTPGTAPPTDQSPPPSGAPETGTPAPEPSATGGTQSDTGATESGASAGTEPSGATGGSAQNRVFPAQAPTPTDNPAPPTTPSPQPGGLTPAQQTQQEIAKAKELRQSTDPQIQQLALATMTCNKPDPLTGNDDPNLPLVTCSTDGAQVYLLDKSRIDGQDIKDASAQFDTQQSRWAVDLTFKNADAWAALTGEYVYKQIAFTLDSKVISAPQVQQGPQQGGSTQITGNFNAQTGKELANQLKYGSLPLSFATSEAQTVSATLGLSSLKAGLIAGAIGLVAVLLYCLLYYRMLGFLAGFSLVASGFAVYGIIVLLGRWINFTLDLAGIAGLIIGIGMTADSFVVFFERIKDEMREGRSFRSAVPRGWARAQRTNLSGKTVSLIASAVLYILAAGQVKGFAFTLGLTTVLDVVVLYLVTAPLMMMASRSPFWAKPSVNGLGAVQQLARERKAAAGVLAGKEA
ncbi:protein translocase subunit SecD [Nocardia blacklockiae]|uniref:protein translocase subunit SecD n=1 Tax=Nocardia blacklockiae TaxID=480036 RepID=UPI001894DEEF|nr:protein translocase subunit SecD [Nocardia blacklockiae]MBF6170260.1 protein translocase subunit SecD [Nocardia blacklockiae]